MNYKNQIIEYLLAVDTNLDSLSNHEEGSLPMLPSWTLQKRTIEIGVTEDDEGVVVKVTPDDRLTKDKVVLKTIRTTEEVSLITAPMKLSGQLPNKQPENSFMLIGDMSAVVTNNPLAVPVINNKFMIGYGRKSGFYNFFNVEKAKEEAINLWNNAKADLKKNKNYVKKVRCLLEKFQAIIKRKAFLERRIHRYINEYRNIFLPPHKNCFYEQRLYLGDEMRKADFILEREQGLPAIFIELESPVHKIFTKKFDLRAPANHARQQISEWVQFVESDPQRNASGLYNFMTGPKERMVIIGKGLEEKDRLLNTKYDGVIFWTYSIMLEETKNRLNNSYSSQCKLLGLEEKRPF
jgi:hypothetical protein